MPLEIRELIIKTKVSNSENNTGNSTDSGKMNGSQINEIVDKILEILKEKSER